MVSEPFTNIVTKWTVTKSVPKTEGPRKRESHQIARALCTRLPKQSSWESTTAWKFISGLEHSLSSLVPLPYLAFELQTPVVSLLSRTKTNMGP